MRVLIGFSRCPITVTILRGMGIEAWTCDLRQAVIVLPFFPTLGPACLFPFTVRQAGLAGALVVAGHSAAHAFSAS